MLKPIAMPLDCVLIGQGTSLTACADILLRRGHRVGKLVSNCPVASAWAQRKGIDRLDPAEPLAAALSGEPFDLLFSIVNHAITPAEVLALPRLGAINFHDSLLPSYSGFNATAWALLDGRTEHGVTWHRMTADVDAGAVLLQEAFPISEDDTAFSLAARASEAAVRSFETLMASIESGTLRETPAQAARDFHFKSDRPGFAVLDFAQPSAALLRTVRALDFGTEDSWMTRAKLRTPAGEYVCVGRASALPASGALAGTVGQVSAVGVEVAAAGGSILLSELSAVDGAPLDRSRLDRLGLVPGARLPAHDTGTARAALRRHARAREAGSCGVDAKRRSRAVRQAGRSGPGAARQARQPRAEDQPRRAVEPWRRLQPTRRARARFFMAYLLQVGGGNFAAIERSTAAATVTSLSLPPDASQPHLQNAHRGLTYPALSSDHPGLNWNWT